MFLATPAADLSAGAGQPTVRIERGAVRITNVEEIRMKAIRSGLLVALFALMAGAPLAAQGMQLGLKGGITSSTLTGDDVDDPESLNSFSGGLFATFAVSPQFALQPELLLVSRGAGEEFEGARGDLKLRYIQIPVLAKFTFGAGPLRPSIFAGPAIAFKTSCEVEASEGEVEFAFDCDDEEFDIGVKSTDFGGVLGVGFDYEMAGMSLIADARVDLGLSSIVDEEEAGDVSVKNRAYTFMVGVSIPVGMR